MSALPEDLVVAIDDLLAQADVDESALEDEVETAQRAIAW